MSITTKQAMKVMNKLELEMVDCSHHCRGFLVVNGKRQFPVHCSFGSKSIPMPVVHRFRKSLKLNVADFNELTSCHLDRDSYIQILNDNGELF